MNFSSVISFIRASGEVTGLPGKYPFGEDLGKTHSSEDKILQKVKQSKNYFRVKTIHKNTAGSLHMCKSYFCLLLLLIVWVIFVFF